MCKSLVGNKWNDEERLELDLYSRATRSLDTESDWRAVDDFHNE